MGQTEFYFDLFCYKQFSPNGFKEVDFELSFGSKQQ
uniref:Uncharacterized protein n=1 Tax=Anguilla anguilla TaxID=7936 RepID=A0A0E9XK23_ANGAN